MTFYELMTKYSVKERCFNDFFKKYLKKEGKDRGYICTYYWSLKNDLMKKGYCYITSNDSITNVTVSFYK